MADVHNRETRSKNMRAIRHCNTGIEQRLQQLLTELGLEARQQARDLPGRPDFVLETAQKVIFTHGCFWHHHHCHLFKPPATRTDFWLAKIGRNSQRDKENLQALERQGWKVLVIWECAMKGKTQLPATALAERLEEWICAGEYSAEIDQFGIRLLEPPANPAT